jgi:histidyl-tRNA synthetase
MKSQMREADRHKAKLVLIVGEQEIADNVVTVRPLTDQPQTTVSLEGKVLEEWIQLFVELPDAPDDPIETKSLW